MVHPDTDQLVEMALEAASTATYRNPEVPYTNWLFDTLDRNFAYRVPGESSIEWVDWDAVDGPEAIGSDVEASEDTGNRRAIQSASQR